MAMTLFMMTRSLRVGGERSDWSSPSGSVLFLKQSGCAGLRPVRTPAHLDGVLDNTL